MQNSVCPFKNNNRMECNEKHIHDDKQSEKILRNTFNLLDCEEYW